MILIQIVKEIFVEFPILKFVVIILFVAWAINILSKFFQNVNLLYGLTVQFILFVLNILKFLLSWTIKIVFFPITLIQVIKKYRYINSKIINNSFRKELDSL